MKNNHLIVAVVLACALTITTRSIGQTCKRHSFLNYSKSWEKAISYFEPEPSISFKAIRDFRKSYPDAEGVKWYPVGDGFVANFFKDDISCLVAYTRHGDRRYSITYYGNKNFPSNLKEKVKKIYSDYTITGMEEIHVNAETIFLVHLHDEFTWKKIMVRDDEVKVVEEFAAN